MGQSDLNQISAEHLLTLYEITRTFSSSLDFDEVLNLVIDSIMEVMSAQRGFLMVADGEALQVKVARGMDGEQLTSDHAYSTTFVRQVVETRQPLLTNNAQTDTRYVPGKSIILAGLRAILCAPMLIQDRLIGVVYVDTAMRSGNFSDSDLQLLNAVAGQAGVAIENARLYQVAVEKGRLERELQMAREIQESLLPRSMPSLAGYEVAARWRSAREVAGDFYDLFMLEQDALSLVIADVSDKGAPAALFMASTRSMIRSHAFAGLSPVDILRRTNDLILEDTESGMFVTVYYSRLLKGGSSIHANAGHNPPMLYRHDRDEVQQMPRGGRAIGWFPDNPIQAVELQLNSGDVIVYYTDGLTDAENKGGEPFGEQRLAKALQEAATRPAEAILQYLVTEVDSFCREVPAFDDLTLCVVRYLGM
jgi:sigma-B regulation protein RsbU (phosphoserine phosphatase)